MKFKSVCKFKIVCEDLQTVMVPLPDCASGEWGPAKATRLFGLIPVSHEDALVFAHSNNLDITFRMTRPLTDFMATLHKNGTEEKKLSKYVSHRIQGEFVTLTVVFPEEGQYGMDIYTREVSNSNGNGTVEHDSMVWTFIREKSATPMAMAQWSTTVWYGHLYARSQQLQWQWHSGARQYGMDIYTREVSNSNGNGTVEHDSMVWTFIRE